MAINIKSGIFLQHTSKRVVLRRLSQDSDGKMLSCEIHLPNVKPPGAMDTILSPGAETGAGAGAGQVFTYNVISGSNSSRGSGVSSPSQPLSPAPHPALATPIVFSPPLSPFALTPTPSPNTQVS